MKIITYCEMVWNGDRYVTTAEKSFNYRGPLAEMKGGKGGGDDGSKEMRRQEEERKRKTAESMAAINESFDGRPARKRGVNKLSTLPSAPGTYYDANGNPVAYEPPSDDAGFFPKEVISRITGAAQPELYSGVEELPAVKGFGDDYFKSIADSYMAFQKPLFEEQLAEARRTLPYRFASTGNSEYIRSVGELERDAARKEAELRDAGESFANERRSEVERTRSDLIGMANAGTDASAVASMAASRAAALAKQPTFSPIADLFQKYTAGLANASVVANNQRVQRSSPLLFNSGTKSVRVVE